MHLNCPGIIRKKKERKNPLNLYLWQIMWTSNSNLSSLKWYSIDNNDWLIWVIWMHTFETKDTSKPINHNGDLVCTNRAKNSAQKVGGRSKILEKYHMFIDQSLTTLNVYHNALLWVLIVPWALLGNVFMDRVQSRLFYADDVQLTITLIYSIVFCLTRHLFHTD